MAVLSSAQYGGGMAARLGAVNEDDDDFEGHLY